MPPSCLGLVQLIFIVNFFYSIFLGRKVGRNPWHATTLEWDAPSPPPHGNFDTPIAVYRGPYEYSVPGAPEDFTPQSQPTAATQSVPLAGEPAWLPPTKHLLMEIPYEVTARPDTGLYNAKLGIWLFLASEVMLFGGLFSAYVFLRMGADPGYWPHGLLNVPVGTANTAILILSSVTVVLAWAALKMRRWTQYLVYMSITIICAFIFLGVKLGYEWPAKFKHFGVFIKKDSLGKYEQYLGNKHLAEINHEVRLEITGDLEKATVLLDGKPYTWDVESAGALKAAEIDRSRSRIFVRSVRAKRMAKKKRERTAMI